jgi:hypothetical protein
LLLLDFVVVSRICEKRPFFIAASLTYLRPMRWIVLILVFVLGSGWGLSLFQSEHSSSTSGREVLSVGQTEVLYDLANLSVGSVELDATRCASIVNGANGPHCGAAALTDRPSVIANNRPSSNPRGGSEGMPISERAPPLIRPPILLS